MIVAVPAAIAVTIPVEGSTAATAVLLEVHEPPASPLLEYIAVMPIHNGLVPLTVPALAFGLTVIIFDADSVEPQPVTVYVIVELPAAIAVTSPVEGSTVATAVLLEDHEPPASPLLE